MTDPLLTRRQLAEWLTSQGFPISYYTLKNRCQPSVNTGPPVALIWCGRPMYDRWAGLAWAKAQCRQPPGQPRSEQPERTANDQEEPKKTAVANGCENGSNLQ